MKKTKTAHSHIARAPIPAMLLLLICSVCLYSHTGTTAFRLTPHSHILSTGARTGSGAHESIGGGASSALTLAASTKDSVKPSPTKNPGEMTAKAVTNEIVSFFKTNRSFQSNSPEVVKFQKYISSPDVVKILDGVHMSVLMFQCARTKTLANSFVPTPVILKIMKSWSKEWSERDISTMMYGIRSLKNTGMDKKEGELLIWAAQKIKESTAQLSSRAIGNALYGLQDLTSDYEGADEICEALASKVATIRGDLNGLDVGIGLYGLQGMSSSSSEVRLLASVLAKVIKESEIDFDEQALSNALYGLQSMTSESEEVLALVDALAEKISESKPTLSAQAIGSALYGLQKLSSESPQVRRLAAALAEKIEMSDTGLDAQAIGNALFGLQKMKSNSPEVRALVQALTEKLMLLEVEMDSKGIGAAIYGLHSMSSEEPQVRALLLALADRISLSNCYLGGQGIADALYGLYGMTSDCPELRALLAAISERIDETRGKLDAQEIGNALYGLQGLSSDSYEVRVIVGKLAEKIKRSKATLRSQHISRSLLGLQRLSGESAEVRYLLKQLSTRIRESDRVKMTAGAISDALFGMQGLTSDIPEVQELAGELAKKISSTSAILTGEQMGRALFGLQGLSTSGSIFEDSAVGLDSDEVGFLLGTVWDKVKKMEQNMPSGTVAQGMLGITSLRDPIGQNIRQYLNNQVLRIGESESAMSSMTSENIINLVRSLLLNDLPVPKWLASYYDEIENMSQMKIGSMLSGDGEPAKPLFAQSRADKLVVQRYVGTHPFPEEDEDMVSNTILDGFRMDMLFPTIKMNIELDGPSHRYPARLRFDKLRDQYIEKKGYTVNRIELFGKKIDDVVAEIDFHVTLKKEKIEDLEIQRMYARPADAMIQAIYAKDADVEGSEEAPVKRVYVPPTRK